MSRREERDYQREDAYPFAPLEPSDVASADDDATQTEPRAAQLGRSVDVSGQVTGGEGSTTSPIDLVYLEFPGRKPRYVTLMLQAQSTSGTAEPPPGVGLMIEILTTIGGAARFVRRFPLQPSIPRTYRLFGRIIDVSVTNGSPDNTYRVTGAIVEGDTSPLGELAATWVPCAEIGHVGVVATQPGVILNVQGFLANSTSTTFATVQFFDTAGNPENGDIPILEMGILEIGGAFALDDSARPEIYFQKGLAWAVSSTPGVLTFASDVGARVDVGWGA